MIHVNNAVNIKSFYFVKTFLITFALFCADIQPPLLKCPAHIVTYALPNENYANVTWEQPFAKGGALY